MLVFRVRYTLEDIQGRDEYRYSIYFGYILLILVFLRIENKILATSSVSL
jgi:hypothetical protein